MTVYNPGEEDEFKMHLRAALEHGVSKDDVKEVLLQAEEVFANIERHPGSSR